MCELSQESLYHVGSADEWTRTPTRGSERSVCRFIKTEDVDLRWDSDAQKAREIHYNCQDMSWGGWWARIKGSVCQRSLEKSKGAIWNNPSFHFGDVLGLKGLQGGRCLLPQG